MGNFLGLNRKLKENEETIFMKNGRILLEKQIVSGNNGRRNPIRSFSAEELKIATNDYDKQKMVTSDSGYKLYKGFLQDRPILVKKFEENPEQYEYAFHDIVFASQMSVHKNFLKLLGCCLETQVPVLVFESVEYGTLADHIYRPNKKDLQPLLWKLRLKIAMDIANSVAYLHNAFPKPIIFRNIKPLNILLDEEHVGKLFDFSISISIPEGESHVEDLVTGAPGLIAPEYLATGCFNEKQDVYSFGVLLLVILTGLMVVDPSRIEAGDEFFLVDQVKRYLGEGRSKEIVDPIILGEEQWPGKMLQVRTFIALAFSCICISAEDRPIMIDVAKELRQMYLSAVSSD